MDWLQIVSDNLQSFHVVVAAGIELSIVAAYNYRKKKIFLREEHRWEERFSSKGDFESNSFWKNFFFPKKSNDTENNSLEEQQEVASQKKYSSVARIVPLLSATTIVGITVLENSQLGIESIIAPGTIFIMKILALFGLGASTIDRTEMYITDKGLYPSGGAIALPWNDMQSISFDKDIGQIQYSYKIRMQSGKTYPFAIHRKRVEYLKKLLTACALKAEAPCIITCHDEILYKPTTKY